MYIYEVHIEICEVKPFYEWTKHNERITSMKELPLQVNENASDIEALTSENLHDLLCRDPLSTNCLIVEAM